MRSDARKRLTDATACTCPGASSSEHCPTHVDLLGPSMGAQIAALAAEYAADLEQAALLAETRAAVLSAAADDLNQHAHTFADTLTPADYARADMALRDIGIDFGAIIAAAWHLALLDAAGRVRETAIHEAAR